MNYLYNNPLKGIIGITNNWFDLPFAKEGLYKIIWNTNEDLTIKVDKLPVVVNKNSVLFLTPHHTIEQDLNLQSNLQPEFVTFFFNSEFYCIFGHDDEVSCNGLLFNGSENTLRLDLENVESEYVKDLFETFTKEWDITDNFKDEMLRILLKRLLIVCTRMAIKRKVEIIGGEANELDIIRKFYILVDQHFKEKKQVAEYADLLHKSPKTLSNIFSKNHDVTPLKVIHNRIDAEARRLLLYTSLNATQIAYELGFDDIATFSRFFTKSNGVSISEFRKQA